MDSVDDPGRAAHDEMVDGRGGLRPQWRGLLGSFQGLAEGGLAERGRRLAAEVVQSGLAASLPGAAPAPAWRCDPVPLPVPEREFVELEAGLAQRARLFSALLDDLYGPQDVLAEGLLPPALVYANPGFLRPCRHPAAAGARLGAYAADLLRGPDGRWRVLADRTGAPAGIAVALENRRLLAGVLPEIFRPAQVRPLQPFLDYWQDLLQRTAPGPASASAGATVALLTSGSAHPGWFEHLLLARELSAALVESGDLAVRDGSLFLKTLSGLRPIDVLLRRIDGGAIDPLELDGPTRAGVPGLLEAARSGRVRISNAPGSALAEAPALAAFLPALCSRLLGEALRLPSVRTLWLGDPAARAVVAADPRAWLLRPALDGATSAVAPASLSDAARRNLSGRVVDRPWQWCAASAVPPSVAPFLEPGGLQPRPLLLRLFLVGGGEAAWQALPGGLARLHEPRAGLGGTLPQGGIAKDVWVLSEGRGDMIGPLPLPATMLTLRRSSGDLPSRVADNLFWLGRSVERLERAARLVRAILSRLIRAATLMPRQAAEVRTLGLCLVEAGLLAPEQSNPAVLPDGLLRIAAPDGGAARVSLASMFGEVARLIEGVRDRLTGDMYATFSRSLARARADAAAAGHSLDALAEAMSGIQTFSTLVAGLAAENMVRGGGFLFLDLGRRLERAMAVAGELAVTLDQPPARIEAGLILALELCDSLITYRSRYVSVIQPAPVLDLVLADQGNPRGLAFQLAAMHGLLDELGWDGAAGEFEGRPRLTEAAAGLLVQVEALVASVLSAPDQSIAAAAATADLRAIAGEVAALSDRISRTYFALLPMVQTLGWSEAAAPTGRPGSGLPA